MNCNFRKLIELIIKENTGPEETTAEVIEKIKAQKYAVEAFIEATTKGTLVAGMSESQKDQIENMSRYVKASNVAIAYLEDQNGGDV